VRHRVIAVAGVLAALALLATTAAWARNPNCAGGIQYVVQGMRDREKGNLEDYRREMLKAVDRLVMCSTEDPEDFEALAYLGWAYAELDSARAAGEAFEKAIAGLKAKSDKKVEWAISNRESYWAKYFNEGVADIQSGQTAYPEYTKEPADDAEQALKAEASNKYAAALAALSRASFLKPADGRTVRNVGTVYALMGDLVKAESVLREGVVACPGDSDLVDALALVRRNYAGKLLDEKRYDEAIGFYGELLKASPRDADLHSGLADAYFKRAFGYENELVTARNAMGVARAGAELTAATEKVEALTAKRNGDYELAGNEYAAASSLKSGEADLIFNAALAFQNGRDYAAAEAQWRDFLKLKPADTDAMSALGAVLAETKRYDDAAAVLYQALLLKPKEKSLHRQLGGVYSGADNQPKSYEEMVVFIALERGTPAENPGEAARKAPAGSDAARIQGSVGDPEELRYWEAEGQKYETWLYWQKNVAYTFQGGKQVAKSDWGAPPPKLAKPPAAAPKAPVRRK
jgi:tetratricopeptide (TPR) repeat protein